MDWQKVTTVLASESKFRLKQAKQAVFVDLITDWQECTVLKQELRVQLNQECPLEIKGQIFGSKKSESSKALLSLADGAQIETVLMRHGDGRNTVCVSSQVGCPMACAFCATGQMGFKRNLTEGEILDQVLFFARELKKEARKITNVVCMGEPFLNYDQVMSTIKVLNDQQGFNLGARHFAISTCGVVEGIKKLAAEPLQINLAISLHAPEDKLRGELMPINKKYPLKTVLRAVDDYLAKKNRRVMFEYLLIKDVNDSLADAEKLIEIMSKPLYLVNLIPYNPTGKFLPAEEKQINKFMQALLDAGIVTTRRHSFGGDIEAACGQLATHSSTKEQKNKNT
jgi:23S rRNA (adenine2503-C2)-methyltransferase